MNYPNIKTFRKSYLPEVIKYNGSTFELDAISSGIANSKAEGHTFYSVIRDLREEGKGVVLVSVLSPILRGKTDLYGNPYKPNVFIFTSN